MNKLFIVTGASGSGKTTVVKDLQKRNIKNLEIFFFDSIGVPTPEKMKSRFGGSEEWQRLTTINWIKKIKEETLDKNDALLDGQIKPSFVREACRVNEVENYEIILFDCSDEVRSNRLMGRGHSELVNPDTMNWARLLREESTKTGCLIIDNTNLPEKESAELLSKKVLV